MGRVTRNALSGRADERAARLARARQRRLELEKGRAERDARIDQAVADVYLAQDEREAAVAAVGRAEGKIGDAIGQVMAEGVRMAQVAELVKLSVNQVQKLRAAAVGVRDSVSTKTALAASSAGVLAGACLNSRPSKASGEHAAAAT